VAAVALTLVVAAAQHQMVDYLHPGRAAQQALRTL